MPHDERHADAGVDFYGPLYARFDTGLAVEMRREVYGADLGQQGWRSVEEQAEIAALLGLGAGSRVLDVACGSGGASLELVARTGCRVAGLDAEPGAIARAEAQAAARGLADRARFSVLDCAGALPFAGAAFDAVLCIDAICHFPDRRATLAEWSRLLRDRGRLLFTDPAVLTGAAAASALEARSSAALFVIVPPALNEDALEAARLHLLERQDRTAAVAEIAERWHAARLRHASALRKEEGEEWFERRQRWLATTAELAASRALSRFLYLAEKRTND